jgi:hypothetical protein
VYNIYTYIHTYIHTYIKKIYIYIRWHLVCAVNEELDGAIGAPPVHASGDVTVVFGEGVIKLYGTLEIL